MSNREQASKTVRLDYELNARLEKQAERMGVSQGYVIRRSLEEFLGRNEKAVDRLSDPIMGAVYRNLLSWASKGLEPDRATELMNVVKKIEQEVADARSTRGGSIEAL